MRKADMSLDRDRLIAERDRWVRADQKPGETVEAARARFWQENPQSRYRTDQALEARITALEVSAGLRNG